MGLFDSFKIEGFLSKGDRKLFDRFIGRYLQSDEVVESVIANTVDKTSYGLNYIPSAFVAITNKRIIHFQQFGIRKSKIKSMPYEQIKSIDMESGFLFTEIRFNSTNNEFSIDKIQNNYATEFVELIENKRNV